MCDFEKCDQIYKDIQAMTPDDALQMVLETDNPEEKEFFTVVGNYLLKRKQRQVIAGDLF